MKTLHGNPITVLGKELKLGDKAPEFKLVNTSLEEKKLSDYKNEYILLSVVPSLDTGVCDLQTRTINEKLASFNNVDFITVSMDLPFAQKRFCAAEGIENVEIVSDYKERDFGQKYGFLIDELKLLSRGTIVIDKDGKIVHTEYVEESTNEVDFDAVNNKIKELV